MKVININSEYELTHAQMSFFQSVIDSVEENSYSEDSINILMNEIRILLVNRGVQEEQSDGDPLGFYQHSCPILGVKKPVIGLCLEKIIDSVEDDQELIILIAKVLIHEFAHAKMKLRGSVYHPIDKFYKWMEEPLANKITLEYFRIYSDEDEFQLHRRFYPYRGKTVIKPSTKIVSKSAFDFVKEFIKTQDKHYQLGLDLFESEAGCPWTWSIYKSRIQKKTKEKQDWLDYVEPNLGNTDKETLENLFDQLWKD